MKSMQHFLFDKWLWSRVTKSKYIKDVSFTRWFRSIEFELKGSSIIWNSFIKILHWIKKHISWDIGSAESVQVLIDPFIGDNGRYKLTVEIME